MSTATMLSCPFQMQSSASSIIVQGDIFTRIWGLFGAESFFRVADSSFVLQLEHTLVQPCTNCGRLETDKDIR